MSSKNEDVPMSLNLMKYHAADEGFTVRFLTEEEVEKASYWHCVELMSRELDAREVQARLAFVRVAHLAVGRGALTLVFGVAVGPALPLRLDIGAAWCSPRDQFGRKTGRRKATERYLYRPIRLELPDNDAQIAREYGLRSLYMESGRAEYPSALDPRAIAERLVRTCSAIAPRWAREARLGGKCCGQVEFWKERYMIAGFGDNR